MTLSIMTPAALGALLLSGAVSATPATLEPAVQAEAPAQEELAAQPLAQGEHADAIATLETALEEFPGDPALLINLGIARAQNGEDELARELFETALASRDVVELETADGIVTDSRRLARRAISMLDRGEFRPQPASAIDLSRRN